MPEKNTPLNAEGEGAKRPLSEAPLKEYAITVKPTLTKNKISVLGNDLFLLEYYIKLCNKYNMVRLVSIKEYDSKGIPHIHGTVLCAKRPFFKEDGWHIYIKEKTSTQWEDYMIKEFTRIRQEQAKIAAYYSKTYNFLDNHHKSPYKLNLNL